MTVFVSCEGMHDCQNATEHYYDLATTSAAFGGGGWVWTDGRFVCPECLEREREELVEAIGWSD